MAIYKKRYACKNHQDMLNLDKSIFVYKLNKALYGLKQAPKS